MKQVVVALAVLLLAPAIPGSGFGQEPYPNQTIRIVAPYPPGGGIDIIARLLAEPMREALGRPVIVENKPGASGMIGAQAVAKSPPDGYTLLLATAGEIVVNPHLYKTMSYDPDKELAPVCLIVRVPNVLVVNPDVPARTPKELVAHARANPGKLTFSSSGVGNPQHLAGEMFNQLAGTDIVHVPYKGSAPALTDVAAKHVSMTFSSLAAALPMINARQVRAIAVTSKSRVAAAPDVPALAEYQPLADYELVNWFGMFAPVNTPAYIIKRLNEVIQQVLKNPEFVQKIALQGGEPAPNTPGEFRQFLRSESAKFARIIADAKVTLDK